MARVEVPLDVRGLTVLSQFAKEGGTVALVGNPTARKGKSSFISTREGGGALRSVVSASPEHPARLPLGQAKGLQTLFGGTGVNVEGDADSGYYLEQPREGRARIVGSGVIDGVKISALAAEVRGFIAGLDPQARADIAKWQEHLREQAEAHTSSGRQMQGKVPMELMGAMRTVQTTMYEGVMLDTILRRRVLEELEREKEKKKQKKQKKHTKKDAASKTRERDQQRAEEKPQSGRSPSADLKPARIPAEAAEFSTRTSGPRGAADDILLATESAPDALQEPLGADVEVTRATVHPLDQEVSVSSAVRVTPATAGIRSLSERPRLTARVSYITTSTGKRIHLRERRPHAAATSVPAIPPPPTENITVPLDRPINHGEPAAVVVVDPDQALSVVTGFVADSGSPTLRAQVDQVKHYLGSLTSGSFSGSMPVHALEELAAITVGEGMSVLDCLSIVYGTPQEGTTAIRGAARQHTHGGESERVEEDIHSAATIPAAVPQAPAAVDLFSRKASLTALTAGVGFIAAASDLVQSPASDPEASRAVPSSTSMPLAAEMTELAPLSGQEHGTDVPVVKAAERHSALRSIDGIVARLEADSSDPTTHGHLTEYVGRVEEYLRENVINRRAGLDGAEETAEVTEALDFMRNIRINGTSLIILLRRAVVRELDDQEGPKPEEPIIPGQVTESGISGAVTVVDLTDPTISNGTNHTIHRRRATRLAPPDLGANTTKTSSEPVKKVPDSPEVARVLAVAARIRNANGGVMTFSAAERAGLLTAEVVALFGGEAGLLQRLGIRRPRRADRVESKTPAGSSSNEIPGESRLVRALRLISEGKWNEAGNCYRRDTNIFVNYTMNDDEVAAAALICKGCLVRGHCEATGLRSDSVGVWGGKGREELKAAKRRIVRGVTNKGKKEARLANYYADLERSDVTRIQAALM